MALSTFTPPMQPSMGSNYTVKVRVISNQFGDGYRQVLPDGLNASPLSFSLTWKALAIADADTIEGFFRSNLGQAFWWQPPRFSSPAKFDCLQWTREAVSGAQDMLTASFNQRFDLGT